MKNREELLKIYSAYLPYELKGKRTDGAKGDYILRAVYDDGSMIWKYDGFGNSRQIGVLPVLYSMDILTKEIEHKGERFIPIERLFDVETVLNWSNTDYIKSQSGLKEYWVRSKQDGKSFYFGYNSEENYFYYIDADGFKMSVKRQLELFQKLFEWHFNVFGLHESEYIKKQSVIQK